MAIRLYSVDAIFCKVRAISVESHLGVSKGIGHYKLPVEGGEGRGEGGGGEGGWGGFEDFGCVILKFT